MAVSLIAVLAGSAALVISNPEARARLAGLAHLDSSARSSENTEGRHTATGRNATASTMTDATVAGSDPSAASSEAAILETEAAVGNDHRTSERNDAAEIETQDGPKPSPAASGASGSREHLRAALLRPGDIDRLIATVRDEYEIERVAAPETELAILQRAAESGKPDALLTLGLYLAYATEGGGDPALAAELFQRAHAAGSARALAEIGRLHLTGIGLPLDPDLAATYFEQAQAAGDKEGSFLLAMSNRLQLFDGADPERARELLIQAAEDGHIGAQITAYTLQQDGAVDFGGVDTVVRWLEAAAATGDSGALYDLSVYYLNAGRTDDAVATLLSAAEAGSAQAREYLALGLGSEPGTPGSFENRLRLIREMTAAPELANGSALFLRAFLESTAAQVGMNDSDPGQWLKLGEARGDQRSKIALIRLERGEDLLQVLVETGPLEPEAAYLKLNELKPPSAGSREGNQAPRPVFATMPHYPAELAATKIQGRAVVLFVVDPHGRVTDPKVVEATHPAFAAAALETLAQWRFTPALKDGRPVSAKMKQPFRFQPD